MTKKKSEDVLAMGLKRFYSEKDIFPSRVMPKECQILLWEAANAGDYPGDPARIRAINEATALVRQLHPELFYPPRDRYYWRRR